jgi:Flp pilus assembly protein TadD
LTILTLFQTPTLRGKHSESVQSVALLASTLWAINPIQTQSVTLIVQRMALLAAFFYLTLIFCPLPGRLSIDQDVALSTSLMHPWTTLPAIVFVGAVIVVVLSQIQRRPLLSFAILFFFLNHKAPGLHRPVYNLAMARYKSIGRLDQALEFYQKAARLKMHRRSNLAGLYGNIAGIYYRKGDYETAVTYFQKAYDIAPFGDGYRYRLAETLNRLQQWKPALAHIDALLARHPRHPDYLNLKGMIFMQRGDAREALCFFQDAIRVNPKRLLGIINAGAALMAIRAYANAEKLFKYAQELDHRNLMTYLRLIDANLRSGDTREAQVLLRQ